MSAWLGVWPNVLLNIGFLLVFAVPLGGTTPRGDQARD